MFREQVLLKEYSHYKIGGPARFFCEPKTIKELTAALVYWRKNKKKPIAIIGAGTNILFNDKGFDGLVIKPNSINIKQKNEAVRVGAGASVESLLQYCIEHSLAGLEWAGGLPGTIGGAVYGNAGAFGGEIKDCIQKVTSMSTKEMQPKIIERTKNQCGFGYRSSVYKLHPGKEIILEITLQFPKGDKKTIKKTAEEHAVYRKQRHPIEYPNIGSVFKNIPVEQFKHHKNQFPIKTDPFPVIPAASVLDAAKLKGASCGGAMISPKHPNFIVNTGSATAQNVKQLIQLAKTNVKERFNFNLEEEIIVL